MLLKGIISYIWYQVGGWTKNSFLHFKSERTSIGLVKSLVFSIKDKFFIFTSNFIDLDILIMLAIAHVV